MHIYRLCYYETHSLFKFSLVSAFLVVGEEEIYKFYYHISW